MSTLLLNRQCLVIDPESTGATVVCEPRANVSRGWCARITPDPSRPIGLWGRAYLEGTPAVRDGRAVVVFAGLAPGRYEAHSTLRSNCGQTVYMEIVAGGALTLAGVFWTGLARPRVVRGSWSVVSRRTLESPRILPGVSPVSASQ